MLQDCNIAFLVYPTCRRKSILIQKKRLAELLEDVAEVNLLRDDCVKILDLDALLLHRITVTDSNATVVE